MRKLFWIPILLALAAYLLLPLPGESKPSLGKRIESKRAEVQKSKRKEGVLTTDITRINTRIDGLQGQVRGTQTRLRTVQGDLDDKRVASRDWPAIGMAGQSVFRWAVWGMAPIAQQAIDKAGITIDDLAAFIPHQANMRIIDAMIKQLKLPADIPVARDIAEMANTSAASVPLATERMIREKQIPSGGLALQIGFGAGLVYAAQVIVIP